MKTYIQSFAVACVVVLITLNLPTGFLTKLDFFKGQIQYGNVGYTTITTATNLSAFPAIHNANMSALDSGKIDVGTTSVLSITSLSNLSTVGTITSGTWNGTTIGVAYNGTGTTSPTSNHVILGNSSSGFKTVNGLGDSGQFLTSNGTGAAPTWQSGSFDTSLNYTLTGLWAFTKASSTRLSVFDTLWVGGTATTSIVGNTGTSTFSSSITVGSTASTSNLVVSGNCMGCPMSYTASSTTFSMNGSQTFTNTIPSNANTLVGYITFVEGGQSDEVSQFILTRQGMTNFPLDNRKTSAEVNPCVQTIDWTNNTLTFTESDIDNDCSVSGLVYYYK